ncbi:hypothetical protein FGG08_001198 [Glutinoglossum americanum]|uniref:EamA domain-containing protein n=1 Tax=Glutinoglossum americanum TaxID=1670608 RepID=A0A9P8L0I1_9PEZI|nr:hypothetical protein FGG08_001198 [Glutinoglossum americanum]
MSLPLPKIDVEDDKISLRSVGLEATEDELLSSPQVKPAKGSNGTSGMHYLQQPMLDSFRRSTDTVSNLSAVSQNDDERRQGRGHSYLLVPGRRHVSRSPVRPATIGGKCRAFWLRNKGLALVLLSQFFGGLMNVSTRLLETSGSKGSEMHPLQILFARMIVTMFMSLAYMWYANIPDFPFGGREVRGLLVVRGISGFFGVTGLYYSLKYLPIAEATVITFLAPMAACFVCSFVINEPFTRTEQIAGLVSLFGVVLIARPATFFSRDDSNIALVGSGGPDAVPTTNITGSDCYSGDVNAVTPAQRLVAIGVAMIGVVGAAQVLLTAGLQYEKSSRATNMVYTQMLFALAFDKIVWGVSPSVISILGSSLILGSAIYVALRRENATHGKPVASATAVVIADEERGLVEGMDDVGEECDEPMRDVGEVRLRAMRV